MDDSAPLPGSIKLLRNHLGRAFLDVDHSCVRALIALQGAHIISCVPAGQGDLLWMSPTDPQTPNTALRGGIPICWPWFGGERSGPSHGIARTSEWTVKSATDTGSELRLLLELPVASIKSQLPEEDWRVEVEFELGSRLSVSLTTTNTGNRAQQLSQALHSYLPVRDIHEARIWGLENAYFIDQLTGVFQNRQEGPVTFHAEVDRIYYSHDRPTQLDDGGAHYLLVEREGSESMVIWNPWIDKSQRLSQFPTDGYRSMVCIEAANAGPDARTIAPGQSHTLKTIIRRV